MKKMNLNLGMSLIFSLVTSISMGQVGGIPIMTTILGDGGDGTGTRYEVDENCQVTFSHTIYAVHLEQFNVNKFTPLSRGEIFYLPNTYPNMSYEYAIGSDTGLIDIPFFEYVDAYVLNSVDTIHLYSYSFDFVIDFSTRCADADTTGAFYIDYDQAIVESTYDTKEGELITSPYPICDYIGDGEIFQCNTLDFDTCHLGTFGPPSCDDEEVSMYSRELNIICNDKCNPEGESGNSMPGDGEARMQRKDKYASIYPNPFHGSIELRMSGFDDDEVISAEILDYSGTFIKRTSFINTTNSISLNLEFLTPGIYFLRIISHDYFHVEKIIKE